jgi:multiple sugar transport system substrate-binding protein
MRKKTKRIIAVLMCTLLIVMSLAGCGKSSSENAQDGQNQGAAETKNDSAQKDSGKVTTITYAIWDKNQEPGMRAMADKFEELNPGIKVKVEVTPWDQYWTKLEAAATGGALPDVFWMHVAQFKKYADAKMLMPLSDKIKSSSEVKLENFPEDLVKTYEYDGQLLAIPKDFDTIGLWYNKTMFDNAKIPYPDETWDWDKLLEAAKKLTDPAKGIYGFAATQPDNNQEGFYNAVYQNGGEVISKDKKKSGYDKPETIEAIKWWTDLIHVHKVSPTLEQFADTGATDMFKSGKLAMIQMGSWMVTDMKNTEYVRKNCDVTVLPKGKQRATIYNGLGNAGAANTKNPEAVWKFLSFLATKEANLIQAQHGSAIPAFKGTQQPWIEFNKDFNLKIYVDQLEYGVIYPNSKTRPKWQEAENDILKKVWTKELSAEEGGKQLAQKMDEYLAEE